MKCFEQRLTDIKRFYELLDCQELKVGDKRVLVSCDGKIGWPKRGVYFFFEPGEERMTSGSGLRVVRIGTHALKAVAKATLWDRLRAHRGTIGGAHPGGGNHRGSVFRLHVGTALIQQDDWPITIAGNWGVGQSAPASIREQEYPLEQAVSNQIGGMPFLWLEVDVPPGPNCQRGYIERNAIALLSNYLYSNQPIDPPSSGWLGRYAQSDKIRLSGLWNVDDVDKEYDPGFLDILAKLIC